MCSLFLYGEEPRLFACLLALFFVFFLPVCRGHLRGGRGQTTVRPEAIHHRAIIIPRCVSTLHRLLGVFHPPPAPRGGSDSTINPLQLLGLHLPEVTDVFTPQPLLRLLLLLRLPLL